jgi:hypothetical protein
MTYQHQKTRKELGHKMGGDVVSIEFILEQDVENRNETSLESEHKYELSKKYTLREKGADRKMRRKSLIKVERNLASAEYRVETYRVSY